VVVIRIQLPAKKNRNANTSRQGRARTTTQPQPIDIKAAKGSTTVVRKAIPKPSRYTPSVSRRAPCRKSRAEARCSLATLGGTIRGGSGNGDIWGRRKWERVWRKTETLNRRCCLPSPPAGTLRPVRHPGRQGTVLHRWQVTCQQFANMPADLRQPAQITHDAVRKHWPSRKNGTAMDIAVCVCHVVLFCMPCPYGQELGSLFDMCCAKCVEYVCTATATRFTCKA
jgi:hypothetical protein